MIQSPSLDLSLISCVTNHSSSIGMLSHSQRDGETSTHTHTRKWNRSMTQEQQPYARVSMSKLCSTCHTHGQSLAHWRSLTLDLSIATLVLASLCVSMCASVSVSESEYKPHSCNQTASRNRDTHSITHSLGIYSFDQSIVGTWSIDQSSPLRDTHTNRMLLGVTHDTWFKFLTRHHHQQQLSLIHSFDDGDEFAVYSSTNIIVTSDRQWRFNGPPRESGSVRDRDRWCFEDETAQPRAQITLPNPVKLSPTSNWQSISQWLSLSNEWRAFEWHQSQSSLDETDIRDCKCSASIIISNNSSSSSSSSYLSSRSSNNSVIVLVKLMQHYLQSSLLDRDDCLNLVDGTNTITDTREIEINLILVIIIIIFLSLLYVTVSKRDIDREREE